MKIYKLLPIIAAIGLFFAFTPESTSQTLYEQEVSEDIGSWQPIGGSYMTNGDDSYRYLSMPFPFYWDNQRISYIYVNTNGFVAMNWRGPWISGYPGNYYSGYNIIGPMWEDMYTYGGVYYTVTGNTGSRVLTIQWNTVRYYSPRTGNFQFQVKLYEGSNSAQIIYGPGCTSPNNPYSWGMPFCCFSGHRVYYYGPYYNIRPGANNVSYVYRGNNTTPWIRSPYQQYLVTGKMYLVGAATPSLEGAIPGGVDPDADELILQRGSVYSDENHPGVWVKRKVGWSNCQFEYEISGPLPEATNPDYQVIYTATDEGDRSNELVYPATADQPVGDPGDYRFTHAKGIAAHGGETDGAENDGRLDLTSTTISGGQYKAIAKMYLDDDEEFYEEVTRTFIIALANDIEITRVIFPKNKFSKKYPLASRIPVSFWVKNIGINDVTAFSANVTIWDEDDNEVYNEDYEWEDVEDPLVTAESHEVVMPRYRPISTGDYKIQFSLYLESAIDDDTRNNFNPRATEDDFYFNVAHDIEAEAVEVVNPVEDTEVFVGRPIKPIGRFANNGVSDISDIDAYCYIMGPLPSTDTIYSDHIIIQDIPQGTRNNVVTAQFASDFIAPEAGDYQICVRVYSADDPVTDNNSVCGTFEVTGAMSGTYTIGALNEGDSRNFATFREAANALFYRGVDGPVTFELTDTEYIVGDEAMNEFPALDLSSKIIGAGEDNPILFKPTRTRSLGRATINLNLYSGAGIGFLFGQNKQPDNGFAAVNYVSEGNKRNYVNSEGYIGFDGGPNKSIKVTMHSNGDFRAPFYMAEGSNNITIKNLIIENDLSDGGIACELPLTWYSQGLSKFEYDEDVRDDGDTYSAGVIMRSRPPYDKFGGNVQRYDTLACENNVISGNEISDFGYGIVSLGTGALYRAGHNVYHGYYNKNNEISNNIISDVARAGIYLGYTENADVKRNRIYNVGGECNAIVGGIMAGGEGTTMKNGYNNVDLNIDGNEISGVTAAGMAYGILVEQAENLYALGDGFSRLPAQDENTVVKNNAVWGLNAESEYTNRVGIHLRTQRSFDGSWDEQMITPREPSYFTEGDLIANNTVVIEDDGFEDTEGVLVGIGIQQAKAPKFMNNAIALHETDISEDNLASALVFYEGVIPTDDEYGMISDRNAYELPATADGAIFRLIETDDENEILDLGDVYDFTTVQQWQIWTGQDLNSTYGNFTDDLTVVTMNEIDRYRVDVDPRPPLGSILDNRGERIDEVGYDIDGNVRGPAGQRYDIGAFEFQGRLRIQDIEVLAITEPAAYKAGTGEFAGEEHVMTEAPVEVKARMRNNGNLVMSEVEATVRIYRENPNGTFPTDPMIETTTNFTLYPAESVEIAFDLADMQGDEFRPEPYAALGDLYIASMPSRYAAMVSNVTPRYKIEVGAEADENNANNLMTKYARFFVKRSTLHLLVSGEDLAFDLRNDDGDKAQEVAAKLNFDMLMTGLGYLGWYNDITEGRADIDVFDRTGWEHKAVDYTPYQTVFWTDGLDHGMTRMQRLDVTRYLESADQTYKKNLIIGSEELVSSLNDTQDPDYDPEFSAEILRADYSDPGYPMADGEPDYSGHYVVGVAVGRDQELQIVPTGYDGLTEDADPFCGLMSVTEEGAGLAQSAYHYMQFTTAADNVTAGVATRTLTRNTIQIGIDWRHWNDIETMLRGVIDFVDRDAPIVPVEIVDFDAEAAGDRVNVSWVSAYEIDVDRFDVEKAHKTEAGIGSFDVVATEKARGSQTSETQYGPIVDRDVNFGSTYVYRLKSTDATGESAYSDEVEVTIGEGTFWLGAAVPNPVRNSATFEYGLDSEGAVNISLYDAKGSLVKTIVDENKPAGGYSANIDASDLSAGAYNLVLRIGDQVVVKQIRVVK